MKTKIHFRSLRLAVNAGMSFPACYANTKLLDTDKGRLKTTTKPQEVTCLKCKRLKVVGV